MKQGKRRTMSICLTDLKEAVDKMKKAGNGKVYISIETYDYDEPDKYDNDFSVSVCRSKEEIERIKSGEKVNRTFIGNGRIWEPKEQPVTEKDADGLPF